jgi:hypothetical protein
MDEPLTDDERRTFFEATLFFMLGQQYDALMMILAGQDKELAENLRQMHIAGRLFCPPPFGVSLDGENAGEAEE